MFIIIIIIILLLLSLLFTRYSPFLQIRKKQKFFQKFRKIIMHLRHKLNSEEKCRRANPFSGFNNSWNFFGELLDTHCGVLHRIEKKVLDTI